MAAKRLLIPDAIERMDTAISSGRLARGRRVNGADGLDMMSVFVPEAWVHGVGPGDGTWMSAFLERGWPEWLVMLGVSLFLGDVDGDAGSQQARAFDFARGFAVAVSREVDSDQALWRYLSARLGPGTVSARAQLMALKGDWSDALGIISDARNLLERRLTGADVTRQDSRAVERAARDIGEGVRVRGTPEGLLAAHLCDFAGATTACYDPTVVLLALGGRGLTVGPSTAVLTGACRTDLLRSLHAATVC